MFKWSNPRPKNITLALLTNINLTAVRGQIQPVFKLLTNENIIFMSKIVDSGLKIVLLFNYNLLHMWDKKMLSKLPYYWKNV